ncbi:MAG: hypothetical protein ACOYT8_04645 [Candidatus Dependentiae bacterium]
MKKILLFLLILGAICSSNIAFEGHGIKRPLPEDFEQQGKEKKQKTIPTPWVEVPSLKMQAKELIIKKLFNEAVATSHSKKTLGFFGVKSLLIPFLLQNNQFLKELPFDLIQDIFFQFILRIVLIGNVLTLQETKELLELVLDEQKLHKEFEELCKTAKVIIPQLPNKQKQILTTIKKLFVEDMIDADPNNKNTIITINTVLVDGKTFLAKIIEMISLNNWNTYFSYEEIAIELYYDLLLLGADINTFIYSPHLNAPLSLFILQRTNQPKKMIKLLIEGGLDINRSDTVNNALLTPLRILILLAHPDQLHRKGSFDQGFDLATRLDDIYQALVFIVENKKIKETDLAMYIADIQESKNRLLLLAIDQEKKDRLLAWYDSVRSLLEPVKTNE